jgi:diguanylate cyclase (GGDEF)-like protein/putative nucleotidyltransferase with HDIG domain
MDRLSPGTRTRLLVWVGLGALVVLRLLVDRSGLDAPIADAAAWIVMLIPIPLAAGASFAVYRSASGDERRFWLMMAIATSLLTISESYWAYSVAFVDPLGPLLPHPFELLQAGAAIAFFAMVISLTRFGSEPATVRVRFYSDVLLSMVVGFIATYRWIVGPLFEGIRGYSTGLLLVGSAYPVLGIVLLVSTFGVVVGLKAYRWRSWERLFAISLTVYTAGILLWPWWYADYQRSGGIDVLGVFMDHFFMAGFYLLFAAALYRLTEQDMRSVSRAVTPPLGRWPWVGPAYLGAMVLCVPALAWAATTADAVSDRTVYMGAAVLLVSLLGVRSWFATLEVTYLSAHSLTDPVTGLSNRRAFDALLPTAVSLRGSEQISIIVFDVDGFGRLNELWGHAEGDRILREVAAVLGGMLDAHGKLFRLGGDDLVALLPGVGIAEALTLAACSGREVERHVHSGGMTVSVSAGVASVPEHATEGEDLVRKAMSAQEWARSAGGARTRVFDESEGLLLDPVERLERIRRGDHLSTVRALAGAVDARDPNAVEHSRSVAGVAVTLAQELGMSEERTALVETAALLHDIGKLAVDDRILARPHALTEEEMARVEEHPAFGERILCSAGVDEILPWIRHHHERWDGAGYPDGLQGEEIPLEARVIAVADAYEVMTSGRPYQPRLTHRAALRHIELEGGSHFDPTLASTFVRLMWNAGPLSHGDDSGAVQPQPFSAE